MIKENFLLVLKGEPYEENEILPLPDSGKIVIGREDEEKKNKPDISFTSLYISRKHAEIERKEDDGYYIKDLGSTNGTWIERKEHLEKLKEQEPFLLEDGDRIILADKEEVTLQCRLNADPYKTLVIDVRKLKEESVILDQYKGEVRIRNKAITLTGLELRLLELLCKNPDRIVTYDEIRNYVWAHRGVYVLDTTPQEINQVIYRLRKRLGKLGNKVVKTVRGVGVKIDTTEVEVRIISKT